jgi:hypothetical protein
MTVLWDEKERLKWGGTTKETRVTAFFMGSTHEARYRNGKGKPYDGKNQNVYLWGNNNKLQYTFSGPNILDLGKKLTISSITKKGQEVLKEQINALLKNGYKVDVEIKGHSRGATIAGNVWDHLRNIFAKDPMVCFVSLGKFDEYSGPVNRLHKFNDVHDLSENGASDSIVVYSLQSGRPFNSPAVIKGAKIYIFTTNGHEQSYIVGGAARKQRKEKLLDDGVYLHTDRVPTFSKKTTDEEHNKLNEFKKNAEFLRITSENVNELVKSLKKLSMTDRRGKLFIDALNEKFNLNLKLSMFGKIKTQLS